MNMIRRWIAAVAAPALAVGGALVSPVAAGAAEAGIAPACVLAASEGPEQQPVQILTVGDSITAACSWQQALSDRLSLAGVPHVITTFAVGGTACDYWPARIGDVLSQVTPDLAYIYCGTGDDPAAQCFGESCTTWAFRSIVEAIHAARTPAPPIVPTLIGYSDATMAPGWLLDKEALANDRIASQFQWYIPPWFAPSWFAGLLDVQRMPGTAVYVDGDDCDPAAGICGVHPNARGYDVIGRLAYDAAATSMGWPAPSVWGEAPLCGMSGHRDGAPRPEYLPC
jgi:lysophospholipase L1-like esterase